MIKLSAVPGTEPDDLWAEVKEYAGKAILDDTGKPKPVRYDFDPDQYENLPEAKASQDWPGEGEIFKYVNNKKKIAAKAAAYQKATADLKTKHEASPEYKRQQAIKGLLAFGLDQTNAEQMADAAAALAATLTAK